MISRMLMRRCLVLICGGLSASAYAQTWEPVVGADKLREVFADTIFERTLREGSVATGRYNADGTGELTIVGQTFERE